MCPSPDAHPTDSDVRRFALAWLALGALAVVVDVITTTVYAVGRAWEWCTRD